MFGFEPLGAVGSPDRKHGRQKGEEGIGNFVVTVGCVSFGEVNLRKKLWICSTYSSRLMIRSINDWVLENGFNHLDELHY